MYFIKHQWTQNISETTLTESVFLIIPETKSLRSRSLLTPNNLLGQIHISRVRSQPLLPPLLVLWRVLCESAIWRRISNCLALQWYSGRDYVVKSVNYKGWFTKNISEVGLGKIHVCRAYNFLLFKYQWHESYLYLSVMATLERFAYSVIINISKV